MDNCVGEVQERNLSTKKTSKPVEVLNCESHIISQIAQMISSQCDYKKKSESMTVKGVSEKKIFTLKTGDFLDSNKENWNRCFEGEANIDILDENGYTIKKMKIKGFAQIENGMCVKISKEINCY